MRTYKLGLAGIAFAGFLLLASPAYAAGLSETQIQAILTLVYAFGASPSTVLEVSAALHAQDSAGVEASGTQMARAAIDPSSLVVSTSKSTARVTVSGSAVNTDAVEVSLRGYDGGRASVINGLWSVQLRDALPSGSYFLQVSNDAGSVLTTGTLMVNANNPLADLPRCPSNAVSQRGENGATTSCVCPPNFLVHEVWGGPSYFTDDSDICTAGMMVGEINMVSGGEVDYMVTSGRNSYPSWSTSSGSSSAWGSWPGSFQIVGPKG